MLRKSIVSLALLFLISAPGLAGEVFGTIRDGSKTVPKGVKIEIISPQKSYATQTDSYGSYRMYIPEKGKCTLKVTYNNQTLLYTIYSYDKSTQYDFSIMSKDGKYSLKRK